MQNIGQKMIIITFGIILPGMFGSPQNCNSGKNKIEEINPVSSFELPNNNKFMQRGISHSDIWTISTKGDLSSFFDNFQVDILDSPVFAM